jgi:type IV secretory pathway TraG/TraD family ATPase VirD4
LRFQETGAKAILAGIKNQIFLPGIDNETGMYASSLLGPTTVLSRTEVDAPGAKLDSERVSESRRDFRQAPELRRLVNYRQAIAIIGTADPILFRFPEPADNGDLAVPPRRLLQPPPTLAQAVESMKEKKAADKAREAHSQAATAEASANDEDMQHSAKESPGAVDSPKKKTERAPLRGREFQPTDEQTELPFEGDEDKEDETCAA